jgi:hypothetical protein
LCFCRNFGLEGNQIGIRFVSGINCRFIVRIDDGRGFGYLNRRLDLGQRDSKARTWCKAEEEGKKNLR